MPNSVPRGLCKPFWELCGTNRAERRHPTVVVSDLLCEQTCPLSPAVTDVLDRRARGPVAVISIWDMGTWS